MHVYNRNETHRVNLLEHLVDVDLQYYQQPQVSVAEDLKF